jgi:hydroxymethylpyrimidine/phosphomethylpyrimidine kinase
MEKWKHYVKVLTIAGSDSGGGAGIQADVKTLSAMGCYATTAITAITVQNTLGVQRVVTVDAEMVEQQMVAVISDIGTDAVKTGMMGTEENVEAVARQLRKYEVCNVVVDPVIVSTSGHPLLPENALETLQCELLPLARVITPNIPEAEILTGLHLMDTEDMRRAARLLATKFNTSVWLKGGHLTGRLLTDVLYDNEQQEWLELTAPAVYTRNTHGTGCTLSSALAAGLARGMTLQEAARAAKEYLYQAITNGADYETGHGNGPVKHFYQSWK